ncbi:hypothetical protein L7F22_040172 [Adiantum nelumboides]|nr:hypothetical protein [Adiantum nelumboides]
MPKNDRADLQALMKILLDFGLAAGLHINFKKSILLPLNSCDWQSVLWPGQLLSPHDVIRHLGYPIGWFITAKQQMEWVAAKLTQKLRYWKLSTWPLHVRLRIVQSIVMAHIQFYLPLLSWTHKDISAFMSQAMELLWKTHPKRKALRLLRMQSTCTPRSHGGLNILNIHFHLLTRKATLLADVFAQVQPWSRMLATMCSSMNTKAYGNWITHQWEVVLGCFEGTIPGCPHSTRLILDWKHVLSQIKWSGRSSLDGNSLRKESLHWSAVFPFPLAVTQPVKAYNLMKMGIRCIEDVVDQNGCVLSFPRACQTLNLGMHHRPIWRDICALLAPLIPIPIFNEEDRLKDWELISNSQVPNLFLCRIGLQGKFIELLYLLRGYGLVAICFGTCISQCGGGKWFFPSIGKASCH